MKKILQLSALLVALMVCFAQKTYASHTQGSDLTYTCIAPGIYVVNLRVYRDCTGIAAPTSASLNMRSPGCNAGRSQAMTKVGTNVTGSLYCAAIGNPCSTTGRPNYEQVTFTTTVTFSTAEQTCPNWFFSWTECCRPNIENLANAQGFNLYSEAYVNLGPPAAPYNNSSPEFSTLNVPIPLVCVGQDVIYSLNAQEQDGDSLSYELSQPLSAAGTVVAYAPNTNISGGGSGPIYLTNPNPKPPYSNPLSPQVAILTGTVPANYTATYPLPSVTVNWLSAPTVPYPPNPSTLIWAATPSFTLDPTSGELRFRPAVHHAGTAPTAGRNKYAVVVQVNEWRKINGVQVKVGYIRRDILFIVEDCGGNVLPASNVQPPKPLVGAILNDTLFQVQACNTTRIVLKYTDPNNDNIKVTFTNAPGTTSPVGHLPSGNFGIAGNNTPNVSAYIDITPLPSDIGKSYLIPVRVEDIACPIVGIQNLVYRITVRKENRVQILGDSVQTICLGESLPINVLINRPDSVRNTRAIYDYQWEAAPGLNNDDRNKQNIVVKPDTDTWYKVRVTSQLNGCVDIDSILVKVAPLPIINSINVGYPASSPGVLPFGKSAKLTPVFGSANTTSFKYRWSPAKGLSDTAIANPVANPLKTTTYTLTVTEGENDCETTRTVEVVVAPFTLPNIITPNNDGRNDAFEFLGIEPNTSLKIYNRWGVLVKEYSDYKNDFKGEGVADGTYYYMFQEPNGGKSYKGWFDIVRK